jgi:hypothetical protein
MKYNAKLYFNIAERNMVSANAGSMKRWREVDGI